jgi:hypothetical protein
MFTEFPGTWGGCVGGCEGFEEELEISGRSVSELNEVKVELSLSSKCVGSKRD